MKKMKKMMMMLAMKQKENMEIVMNMITKTNLIDFVIYALEIDCNLITNLNFNSNYCIIVN